MFRILLALLILIIPTTNGFCVTQWNKAIPATGDNLTAWPGAVVSQWSIIDTLLSNYTRGESLIYKNATTLTILSGEVVVSNSGASLRIFLQDASNTDITTTNLDTGSSFSASTTYYVYAGTSSATASSSTYYISLSSSAPTGVTYYKQLGRFTTDSNSNIYAGNIVNNPILFTGYGAKVSKSVTTIYQALTDGILTDAFAFTTNSSAKHTEIYTDSTSTPSTLVAQTYDTNASNGAGTHTVAVRKGDYYQVTDNGNCNHTIYFTPSGV